MPCQKDPLPKAMHPGRQHMITQLGVSEFFDSVFDPDPTRRQQAAQHLSTGLERDFIEVSYTGFRGDSAR